MRAIFSTVLIILASSTLGKEATLEQHLKDDTDLSQVSPTKIDKVLYNRIQVLSGFTTERALCPSSLALGGRNPI